jgi:Kef-type K+ transport system membrane component KefB
MHERPREPAGPAAGLEPPGAHGSLRPRARSGRPGALRALRAPAAVAALALPAIALAAGQDPVTPVLLALAVVLGSAKLGGEVAVRLGQPAVLGELLVGVALGNLGLLGFHGLDFLRTDPTVDMLARLGVVLLLFEVGVESTVGEMAKVGPSAALAAVLGVVTPFALGWGVSAWLLPAAGPYVHAFLGATLAATSVGITARVLQDLDRSRTAEARIILGAAVVDDVLGLVVLAVVAGVIAAADSGTALSLGSIAAIVARAFGFLAVTLAVGVATAPAAFRLASRLRGRWTLLSLGLALAFGCAWLAGRMGLAPIIGAFAAGLVLEPRHFQPFTERGERSLEDLLHPISAFLVPVFFVVTGMNTDLASFARPGVLGLAAALTAAGVLGKLACGLGVVQPGVDRLTVAVGMIPRGEVGLIFAGVGLTLQLGGRPVLDAGTYAALVILVIVTTLVTPPALRWSIARRDRSGGA